MRFGAASAGRQWGSSQGPPSGRRPSVLPGHDILDPKLRSRLTSEGPVDQVLGLFVVVSFLSSSCSSSGQASWHGVPATTIRPNVRSSTCVPPSSSTAHAADVDRGWRPAVPSSGIASGSAEPGRWFRAWPSSRPTDGVTAGGRTPLEIAVYSRYRAEAGPPLSLHTAIRIRRRHHIDCPASRPAMSHGNADGLVLR